MFIIDNYDELTDDTPVMKIYNAHYMMLKDYSRIMNEMVFIITHNNLSNNVLNKIKTRLLFECQLCKSITFIVEKNIPQFREGIIFKKYVIDKLNDYDGLTFWAHSKGVTNKTNINNLTNTLKWLYMMYYSNIIWFHEVQLKLDDKSDYISYGTLYYKDRRHNLTHNWFYSGSFFWLNTKKLYKYIQDNNIDITDFVSSNDENLLRCAEIFVGQVIDEKYAAFHFDEHYNKSYEHFLNYGTELSYEFMDEQIKVFFKPYEYAAFINNFNALLNILNI
jgi:hypothetical protein